MLNTKMAASMGEMELAKEPAYYRMKSYITAEIEDALQKGKIELMKLSNLQSLHDFLLKENKLIHILIRGRNAQLRREKFLQLLKRVKACLQRVDLMNRLFTLGADLLDDIKICLSGKDHHVYVPCKQSWTYLLYLISQYYELLQQAISYSLSAFQCMTCALTTRQLVRVIVMFMAVSARVWQVCTALSDKLAYVYNQMYSVQECMEAAKSDWSCPDLPKELLRASNVPCFEDKKERKSDEGLEQALLDESPRIEDFASSTIDLSLSECLPVSESCDMDEDLGVAIGAEEFQKAIKRKAEPVETENTPKTKKKKNEKNVLSKNKKEKKKKRREIIDSENTCDDSIIMKTEGKSELFEDCKISTERIFDRADDVEDIPESVDVIKFESKEIMVKKRMLTASESNETLKLTKKKKKKKKVVTNSGKNQMFDVGRASDDKGLLSKKSTKAKRKVKKMKKQKQMR